MPSYIELDKQVSFPSSSNVGKIILGVNSDGTLQLTNSNGQSVNASPTYNVYTALLTQSGGSDPNNQASGAVTKGVTYTVDEYFAGTDFTNVGGGTFANQITSFVATSNDTPTNYSGSTLDFNNGAPVVNVLENTIGNIWFQYDEAGQYFIQSNGLFTGDKTIVFLGSFSSSGGVVPVGTYSVQSTNSLISFYTGAGGGNNTLNGYGIEIRVYN